MIILDFETNTHNIGDVIEVAAVKLDISNDGFKIVDKFHRYYLSRFPVNFYSYKVHRLTPDLIMDYRKDKEYPAYFNEDEEFKEFCYSAKTLVAHNISFELRHIDKLARFENHICTMKENKHLVKSLNSRGNIKNPSLDEVCDFYGIEFDESSHHSATYDVSKTFEILKRMNILESN
ncbi:exonuclease domain-containing protein [Arcobacter sp. YIC-464]|uniref:3'-5' exonuclease n=1 Tax=Arcobacter sp. YIC-464 TaxID=3376631 RepID=UPI003C1F7C7E